jgi:uncharacterized membrane protein
MSLRSLLLSVIGLAILVLLSFIFGGLLGLTFGIAIALFILVELVYYYGAKGSLARSFRSNVSSDAPDAQTNTQSPRGYYDLDYRGRGKS